MPTRTRLSPEQRKQQLLDAGVTVFAKRGIGRAAHADIAEATGVSVPTVFNYFKSREDLVDAVLAEVEHFFLDIAKQFHQCKDALIDPVSTLQNHSFSFLRLAKQKPNMTIIWLEWSASVRDDSWPRYIEFQDKVLDIIEPTIQAGLNIGQMKSELSARDLARILYGQAHPVALAYFAPNPPIQDMMRFVLLGMNALLGIQTHHRNNE